MALYLITGGAGFIGSNIAEELIKRGDNVRILDDFSTGRRVNLEKISTQIDLIEGTITDFETCRLACEGVDYVLHQAALSSVPRSVKDPVMSNEVNVGGIVNMLWAATRAKVKRFVYAASSSAYGDTPTLPKHEGMPSIPQSPYAVSKLAGEQYCNAFYKVYGLETVCLRYFNIYGPKQDPDSVYGAVIPIFCKKLIKGESPSIHGDGNQTRDFTFIADAVQANIKACHAPPSCAGSVMNIGAAGRISILDIFLKLRELLGADQVEPIFTKPRAGDVRDSFASVERANELIGYKPQFDVNSGLELAIGYYRRVCS